MPPSAMHTAVAPVAESDRYEAMDVVRGVPVLGILILNIQSFAMPMAAYFNPTALGEPSASDFFIWSVNYVLADSKFMTMFSLLFGAGVLLMTGRITERGGRPALIHYRRMFWLLVFGLAHAYLIWYGDILVLYAICGLLVYPARRLAPRTLAILGVAFLSVTSLIAAGATFMPPEQLRELNDTFWRPPPDRIAREIAAFQGGWLAQTPERVAHSWEFHAVGLWAFGIWRAGGLMLIGMALLKWRVLTGEREPAFYGRLAAAGLALGIPVVGWGLARNNVNGWTIDAFFLGGQWNYWGSVLVSLGWIGLVLRLWRAGFANGLFRRLAAAGRMAFTCYILETLICTTVFYGHGLGLFGTMDRFGQMLVVFAVWVVILLMAPAWLARFRFGPLEWLWRTLTYMQPAAMLRRRSAPVSAA